MAVGAVALLLTGCPMMLVDNAANYAEQARGAAQACNVPVVAEAAARAEQSARDAAAAGQAAAAASAEEDRLRRQARNLRERAQQAREAGRRKREEAAAIAEFQRTAAANAAELAASAEDDARHFRACQDDLFCGPPPSVIFGPSTGCSSASDCSATAREHRATAARLATADADIKQALADADGYAGQAADLDRQAAAAEEQAALADAEEHKHSIALTNAEIAAAQASAAAQEAAFESCALAATGVVEPPAPVGGYQQDIFGAQSVGLPGAAGVPGAGPSCSPAFQGLCVGIQASCLASCSSTGSCSPGAPSPCASCFAQGCF